MEQAPMLLLLFLVVATSSTAPVAGDDGQAVPPADPLDYWCTITGVDRLHSKFQANLVTFSLVVPANASASGGFFKGSLGAAPDTVYLRALCRGDTADAACSACLQTAFQNATELCSTGKDVIVFYDQCQLGFSDKQDFLAAARNEPTSAGWSADNISVPMFLGWDPNDGVSVTFTIAYVSALLHETARLAAYSTPRRFATAVMDTGGAFPTLYSMAQCTPDQLQDGCLACLRDMVQNTHKDFYRRRGGHVLGIRCSFRYESYLFYSGSPMRIYGTTLPHGRRSKLGVIAVVVSLFLLLICFIIGFGWIRSHRKGKVHLQEKSLVQLHQEDSLVWTTMEENVSSAFRLFDFAQIQEATCNFPEEKKLGQGGFGPVYKGKLSDGMEIAVKRLSRNSGQGFVEFKNEVQLIAKLQHTNLVRLLGCCSQGKEKMLVYEYLPNKSLDLFIFDTPEKRALLDWKRRLMIIHGIAQGLLYLHKHSRLHIVHRDLKASNILLDLDMNPKISDFGIAKISISNDVEDNTNTVIGTYGYMAPEYAYDGFFSSKSDVFSFGVLLLEILSGKRNSVVGPYGGLLNLLGYAWLLWKEGKWHDFVDTSLVIENNTSELFKCINIALLCVQENAADRPTMWDITTMLSNEGARLSDPKHPAYYNIINMASREDLDLGLEPRSVNEVTPTAQQAR